MPYTIALHQHRFAAWAAARAAQRGLAVSTRVIMEALEYCGVVPVVDTPDDWPPTAAAFDAGHRIWCREFLKSLSSANIANATYGRAAKSIAVYLKSRIVLGGHHHTTFAAVLHPPIDRILLQALARQMRSQDPSHAQLAKRLRAINWTSLNEVGYHDLIATLRRMELDQPAFWHLENLWDPRGDDE